MIKPERTAGVRQSSPFCIFLPPTPEMAAMVIFSSPPKNSMGLAEKKEGNILMLEVHSSWAPFWRK